MQNWHHDGVELCLRLRLVLTTYSLNDAFPPAISSILNNATGALQALWSLLAPPRAAQFLPYA